MNLDSFPIIFWKEEKKKREGGICLRKVGESLLSLDRKMRLL